MKGRCLAAGILNIILAALTFVYAIIMTLCLGTTILMWFSLFFVVAVLGSILFFFLTSIAFFATAATFITGLGSIITSFKIGKVAKAFSIASIIVDSLFLFFSIFPIILAVGMLCQGIDGTTIAFSVLVLLSAGLAVANICVNGSALKRQKSNYVNT